jgi:flagellin
MPLVINTNVSSLNAQRHLQASRNDLESAMERLSSGKRINSAMEDAAGLTIAHSLETKVKSLETAARNANDAISLIHLAEGAMDAVSNMLVRMRELATQALNGTYSDTDRSNLNAEFQQLSAEITRVSDNTYFNGISVIGKIDRLNFQIGYSSTDAISLDTQDISSGTLGSLVYVDSTDNSANAATAAAAEVWDATNVASGIASTSNTGGLTPTSSVALAYIGEKVVDTTDSTFITEVDLTSLSNASTALGVVDDALTQVDNYRVSMGAVANRLDHSVENLYTRIEQQTAAMSRIQDADYAVESANLARAQVLQQAGTAMLAQANASTQNVLSLLK